MIPFECTHGSGKTRCKTCRAKQQLGIFQPLIESKAAEEVADVMVWEDSPRQGKSGGKQNKQRELIRKTITIKELVKRFKLQLKICTPHYQLICWIKQV